MLWVSNTCVLVVGHNMFNFLCFYCVKSSEVLPIWTRVWVHKLFCSVAYRVYSTIKIKPFLLVAAALYYI